MNKGLKKVFITLLIYLGLELITGVLVVPTLGVALNFSIFFCLYFCLNYTFPAMPYMLLSIQYFHSFFSSTDWAVETLIALLFIFLIKFFKDVLRLDNIKNKVIFTFFSYLIWYFLRYTIHLIVQKDFNFILDHFYYSFISIFIISLVSIFLFKMLEKVWQDHV